MDAMIGLTMDAMIGLTMDAMMAMIYCEGCGGNPPCSFAVAVLYLARQAGPSFVGLFARNISCNVLIGRNCSNDWQAVCDVASRAVPSGQSGQSACTSNTQCNRPSLHI